MDFLSFAPELRQIMVVNAQGEVIVDTAHPELELAPQAERMLNRDAMGLGTDAPVSLDGRLRLGRPMPGRFLRPNAVSEGGLGDRQWTIPMEVSLSALSFRPSTEDSPRSETQSPSSPPSEAQVIREETAMEVFAPSADGSPGAVSRMSIVAAINPVYLTYLMQVFPEMVGTEIVVTRADRKVLAGLRIVSTHTHNPVPSAPFTNSVPEVLPIAQTPIQLDPIEYDVAGLQSRVDQEGVLPLSGLEGVVSVSVADNAPFSVIVGTSEEAIWAEWWRSNQTVNVVLISLPLSTLGLGFALMFMARDRSRLQLSVTALSGAVEQAPVSVIITDRKGVIRYVNPAFTEMFGWSAQDAIGMTPRILKSNKMDAQVYRTLWSTLSEGKVWQGELLNARRDGTDCWVSAAIAGIQTREHGIGKPQTTHYVSVESDITAEKQRQATLTETIGQLNASNRELERFAYVASHDLQEPLRMVTGYLTLLRRRFQGNLDTDGIEFLDYAVDGAERMRSLIQDLLSYSRAGSDGLEMQMIDLSGVLQEALEDLGPAMDEANASVHGDMLPEVWADPGQIRRVFENLIGNALKYRDPTRELMVHVSAVEHEAFWQISVRDTGVGIDAAFHDRIFGVFQRLHGPDSRKGNGIGLAVCRRIVELHGGTISVDSTEGIGSTFSFTLQKAPADLSQII